MKKKVLILLTLILVVCLAFALSACKDNNGGEQGNTQQQGGNEQGQGGSGEQGGNEQGQGGEQGGDTPVDTTIGVPTELTITEEGDVFIEWKRVTGASSYELSINGNIVSSSTRRFNISNLDKTNYPTGEFVIKVRALSDGKAGEWSEILNYKYQGSALNSPNVRGKLEGTKISWERLSAAKSVAISVNGTETVLDASVTSYDLASVVGQAEITVTFKGDGVYLLDSAPAKVVYDSQSKKLALASPTNARMEGSILKFDEVVGADIYWFLNVKNTLISTREPEVDLTNGFLVKEVYAANSSSGIERSAGAKVAYFTDEQGKGTEADPYKISTRDDLRFIEYYESINEAKYYVFTNDIDLGAYSPQKDEDISNFYDLGSLSGVIDGAGYSLKNLVIWYKDGYSAIFKRITKSGVIKNLVIEDANFHTWTNKTNDGIMHEKGGECSIIATFNRGLITNVTIKNATILADRDGASCLVSINEAGGRIEKCVIDAETEVYGENEAGGIAILNEGSIDSCYNYGKIQGGNTVGGIVGRNDGTITYCYNAGQIFSLKVGGGIAGYNYNVRNTTLNKMDYTSTIAFCGNEGDVVVSVLGGGIVGQNGSDGYAETGKNNWANATVASCYNVGNVVGCDVLGGIVGSNYGYLDEANGFAGVNGCYNVGIISADQVKLSQTRIFVDISDSAWVLDDNGVLYIHYWAKRTSSVWPGVKLKYLGVSNIYYADLSCNVTDLVGVMVNRVDPNDHFSIWNKGFDYTGPFEANGALVLKVAQNTIKTDDGDLLAIGSVYGNDELILASKPSAGGVAGYNNEIRDCYYLNTYKISGSTVTAGVAYGNQYNRVYVNGEDDASAAAKNDDGIAALTDVLNASSFSGEDCWTDGETYPIIDFPWKSGFIIKE